MNEMQVFQNSEFGELGVLEISGKPYFPATACAKILGYQRPADAITAHCKGSVKHRVPTKGGDQEIKIIPEGDLYRLITHSKLPAAERFEKWVFDEVLPSIRQTGGYGSQMAGVAKLTAQITQTTAILVQAVNTLAAVANKLVSVAGRVSETARPTLPQMCQPLALETFNGTKCKLETFPSELTEQVDGMLTDMLQQQALNFSMIARYCTINGYTISSPAVKTYFQRHFTET